MAATSRAIVRLIKHSRLSKRFRGADRTDGNKNREMLPTNRRQGRRAPSSFGGEVVRVAGHVRVPDDEDRARRTSLAQVGQSRRVDGCGAVSSPASVNPPVPITLTISHVGPKEGWPFYYTEVYGTGFSPGVRVTFGGVDAALVTFNKGILVTNPPWREPGTLDVTVTKPDGSSVTLAAGFTYKAATLELSKADVGAGESLVVTWSGPPDPSDFAPPDVIGLYAVDDPSNTALWTTTSGVDDRFSAQFKAPLRLGVYEVRYHMLSQYLLAKVALVVR
jgi:hypothetical protein